LKLIDELRKELGITVLFIANNVNLVFIVSGRVAVLYKGKIIEVGTSQEIKREPIHPYTRRLLGITPVDREISNLIEPDFKKEISLDDFACSYFCKCEERMEICKKDFPILTKIGNTHWVNCHRVINREVDNESTSISH